MTSEPFYILLMYWLPKEAFHIFPTKPYGISGRRSNDFEKRGMTVPESQTTSTANNYRAGSARTSHRNIH